MSRRIVSDAALLTELEKQIAGRGGKGAFARQAGLPASYVSAWLSGRWRPDERLANALGYVRIGYWRSVKDQNDE